MSNNKDFKVRSGIQPTVYQEGVGTVVSGAEGYSLAGASYDSKSLSVASQDGDVSGLFIKPDGTKLYINGQVNDRVYQYSLSTAWDLSSATYDNVSFSVSAQDINPLNLRFKSDGTKFYILGGTNSRVYQYSLSTAWDLSSAAYDSVAFDPTAQGATPRGIDFKDDGTKFYVGLASNDTIYQYGLTTAWDLSTASYDSVSFYPSDAMSTGYPAGVHFADNGSVLFISNGGTVFKYTLSTAYNLSTATFVSGSLDLTQEDGDPKGGIFVKTDGSKFYATGGINDSVYQYSTALTTASLDLSSGSVFDYTPTSDVQVTLTNPAASGTSSGATLLLTGGLAGTYDVGNAVYSNKSLDVSSQVTGSMGLKGITFNSDGTSLYILAGDAGVSTSDAVYQYTLSTAFDLSTGSYASKTLNVGTRETTPTGISFNNDGTKLFIIGYNDDLVETWNLSSGYDISTASYATESFSISSQEDFARHINFNSDGTKMYITGNGSSRVQEYSLSTAFNVTTASFTDNFNPTAQASAPFITLFNGDGTKMYVQQSSGILYQYSLSTAFDVSTGSYDNISFTLTEGGGYQGLFIGNNGLNLYSASSDDSKVYQYSTVTPATITYDPNLQWPGGTAPTAPAIGETDVLTFNTTDGGTTYKSVLAIDGAK